MKDFPAEYSSEERRRLLRLAHRSIRAAVRGEAPPELEPAKATLHHAQPNAQPAARLQDAQLRTAAPRDEHLHQARGAFTTLHEDGELRGCIGMVMAVKPLDQTVREMARAAALEDPRFAPVTEKELERLLVEISVLSPMFEIAPEDVVVGRHGLMISYGGRRGLLLPQVATEWGWNRETFLSQACRKAGLPLDQWKHGARIEAFTAEVFGEREPGESLRD